MAELKYTGGSDVRSFLKSDFTRHDIDDQGAVKFNGRGDVQTVSESAADYLIEHDKQFERADDGQQTLDTDSGTDGADGAGETTEPVADAPQTSPGRIAGRKR